MATTYISKRVATCRSSDNAFFAAMALLILAMVFVGFARTYYLAGVFNAPLPNLLVHIHGAVFTGWIVMLIIQTSLVSAGRVDLHRRLGLLGFGLACLVVITGILVATDSLARHYSPDPAGEKVRAFYTVTLSTMVAFGTLVYFAFRNRFNPAAHKRLILIATIAILDAAFSRWPVHTAWWNLRAASFVCTIPLLLLIVGYDYWSTGKVLRSTMWASIFVVALQQGRGMLGHSAVWQSFAAWVQMHARSWHI